MVTIDVSGKNKDLYDGRVKWVNGSWRIEVQGQEGVEIVTRNVRRVILAIPEEERDEVTITGIAPRLLFAAAQAVAMPFFKKVHVFDGVTRVTLPSYIHPPEDLESDPD